VVVLTNTKTHQLFLQIPILFLSKCNPVNTDLIANSISPSISDPLEALLRNTLRADVDTQICVRTHVDEAQCSKHSRFSGDALGKGYIATVVDLGGIPVSVVARRHSAGLNIGLAGIVGEPGGCGTVDLGVCPSFDDQVEAFIGNVGGACPDANVGARLGVEGLEPDNDLRFGGKFP